MLALTYAVFSFRGNAGALDGEYMGGTSISSASSVDRDASVRCRDTPRAVPVLELPELELTSSPRRVEGPRGRVSGEIGGSVSSVMRCSGSGDTRSTCWRARRRRRKTSHAPTAASAITSRTTAIAAPTTAVLALLPDGAVLSLDVAVATSDGAVPVASAGCSMLRKTSVPTPQSWIGYTHGSVEDDALSAGGGGGARVDVRLDRDAERASRVQVAQREKVDALE